MTHLDPENNRSSETEQTGAEQAAETQRSAPRSYDSIIQEIQEKALQAQRAKQIATVIGSGLASRSGAAWNVEIEDAHCSLSLHKGGFKVQYERKTPAPGDSTTISYRYELTGSGVLTSAALTDPSVDTVLDQMIKGLRERANTKDSNEIQEREVAGAKVLAPNPLLTRVELNDSATGGEIFSGYFRQGFHTPGFRLDEGRVVLGRRKMALLFDGVSQHNSSPAHWALRRKELPAGLLLEEAPDALVERLLELEAGAPPESSCSISVDTINGKTYGEAKAVELGKRVAQAVQEVLQSMEATFADRLHAIMKPEFAGASTLVGLVELDSGDYLLFNFGDSGASLVHKGKKIGRASPLPLHLTDQTSEEVFCCSAMMMRVQNNVASVEQATHMSAMIIPRKLVKNSQVILYTDGMNTGGPDEHRRDITDGHPTEELDQSPREVVQAIRARTEAAIQTKQEQLYDKIGEKYDHDDHSVLVIDLERFAQL